MPVSPLSLLLFVLILFGVALSDPVADEIAPSSKSPFIQPLESGRAELHKLIRSYMTLEPGKVTAHPAAADFPGAVESKERVNRTVTFDPNLVHRWDIHAGNAPDRATGPDAWQETGWRILLANQQGRGTRPWSASMPWSPNDLRLRPTWVRLSSLPLLWC